MPKFHDLYCFLDQKPAVKPTAPSKKAPAKNGTGNAPSKKGKPASSSSESSEDSSSDEEEVSAKKPQKVIVEKQKKAAPVSKKESSSEDDSSESEDEVLLLTIYCWVLRGGLNLLSAYW